MQLFWEEAKKPFKSKRTLLIMLAILLIQIGSVFPDYFDFTKRCGSVEAYNEYANAYNNQISEKYVKKEDITKMLKDSYIGRDTSKETIFYNQYLAAVCRSISWKETKENENVPVFWNSIGINKLVQNLNSFVSGIFIFIGLLFGVSCIFIWDEENGMDQIIYSSSRGRKHIISAKCFGCFVFAFTWATIYYFSIAALTIGLYHNANALKAPINSIACLGFCETPIKVWQFLGMGYICVLIGSILISMLFALVYTKIKNNVLVLGIGMLLVFMPVVVPKNGVLGKIFCMLPTSFCDTSMLIGENVNLSILNRNISIVNLGCIFLIIISVLVYLIIKKTFWKGRVE
ncbi:MAG TPA: hypothetical protein DCW90_00595 [Lachnospiraceae bacterium]|nr:ABC transporter permease subunit [uncultured Lachnoclostridium sp.]HAU84065.1 hypothetical protein [Lachnospiraceae bacterium]